MMLTTGIFQAIQGIVALADDTFYVSTRNYTFEFDITTWGWIHLLVGAALVLVGVGVMGGATWARVVGIVVVVLAMFDNFLFVPYYPVWSLLIIALDVAIVWALSGSFTEIRNSANWSAPIPVPGAAVQGYWPYFGHSRRPRQLKH